MGYLSAIIQISNPNRYYKGSVFCRNKLNNGKHGQGNHCTKMGVDKSAKYTPNAQNLFAQFVCPNPKFLDFNEKGFIGHS